MPQDDTAVQAQTTEISRAKLMGWFDGKLSDPNSKQYKFINDLHAKLKHDPNEDEVVQALTEMPSFQKRYRLQGAIPKPSAPTARADTGSVPNDAPPPLAPGLPPVGQRLAPPGTAKRRQQNKIAATLPDDKQPGARLTKEAISDIPFATGVLATAMAPEVGVPARLALAGAGAAAGSVAAHGASRALGTEQAAPVSDIFSTAAWDALNKGVVPESIGSFLFKPALGLFGKAVGKVSELMGRGAAEIPVPEVVPEPTAAPEPEVTATPAPGVKALPAPIAKIADITELQNASGLSRERIEPLTKLKPWEMQARVDLLRRRLENELSPIPDLNTGGAKAKPNPEVMRQREGMHREIKALELLLKDKGVTPAGSPRPSAPARPSEAKYSPGQSYEQWRNANFKKTAEGHWNGTIDDFTADFTDERMHTEYDNAAAKHGKPPSGTQAADYPKLQIEGAPVRGKIEPGPSGFVPDPRAQSRIAAPLANEIAEKFKVPPSKLVELSGLPNQDLVKLANQMTQAKRGLLADSSDTVTQASGAVMNKSIVLDELEKWIGAIQHMQLYREPPAPR